MNESNKTMKWWGWVVVGVGVVLLVVFYFNSNYKKVETDLDSNSNAENAVSTSTADVSNTAAVIPVKTKINSNDAGLKVVDVKVECVAGDLCKPPVISGVYAKNITAEGVDIGWTTDQPASTAIFYSASEMFVDNKTMTLTDPSLSKNHLISMGHLNKNTNYKYFVLSTNSAGVFATSSVLYFRTLGW